MNDLFTPSQKAAIDAKRGSILVAAGAGAGKTKVLVERIINIIGDKTTEVEISNILVVTFTNAAAGEMRMRIGKSFNDKMLDKDTDKELKKKLKRQITLLGGASIMTIHSFCLEVIRSNFNIIGIDPTFSVGDNAQIELIKYKAIDEVFETFYHPDRCSDEFLSLVDAYGGRNNDLKLQEIVLEVYKFIQASSEPEKWLRDSLDKLNVDDSFNFAKSQWGAWILEILELYIKEALNIMKSGLEIISMTFELDKYFQEFTENTESINDLLEACIQKDWEAMSRLVHINFNRLPSIKGEIEEKAIVQEKRNEVKEIIAKLDDNYFSESRADNISSTIGIYGHMNMLSDLVLEFKRVFAEKKKDKNIVDFNDLEHFALEILKNDDVANMYKNKYEEIFIDEYQDSNNVQESLLTTVSRNKQNIFMVGDVKQSIYKFRQARPEIFMEKYMSYSENRVEEKQLIKLNKNFRSDKNIIDITNYVFSSLMSMNIGEMDYGKEEELVSGKEANSEQPSYPIEMYIIDTTKDEVVNEYDDGDESAIEEDYLENIELEARVISQKIKEMVKNENVAYKDIVILLRATKSSAPILERELKKGGIPVFSDTGAGYYKTIEIRTIIALLTIIDNPRQDIPMLAVLRSPIAKIGADELIAIRKIDKEKGFYELMKVYAETEKGSKIAEFLERLEIWRDKADYMPVDELIWELLDETHYYAISGGLLGGVQRQANLKLLFERAKQFENTSYKGLFNFLNFINSMKERSGDYGEAKILTDNNDVVRIMSIHKSKGLEFPIVFLAGTGKGFNKMDASKQILLHQDMGFGTDYIDYDKKVKKRNIIRSVISEKILHEALSEEMRILYVAMTRAKERLIITAAIKGAEKKVIKWSENAFIKNQDKLSFSYIMKAAGYIDYIVPILMRKSKVKDLIDIDFLTRNEIVADIENKKARTINILEVLKSIDVDEADYMRVCEKLEWEYPYKKASVMETKRSVSDLKQKEEVLAPKLKQIFVNAENTAANKGNIIHFILQKVDFKKIKSKENFEMTIAELFLKERSLQEVSQDIVNVENIWQFINSELGQRIVNSQKVCKETAFAIEIPYSDIDETLENIYMDEKIMIQGIIDCYFIEGKNTVLIDYKTGKYYDSYKSQMYYYSMALEKAGFHVSEKYIVFIPIDDREFRILDMYKEEK